MAVDIHLQLKGIDGDSTDKAHTNWIEVSSIQWSVSHAEHGGNISGGGSAAGGKTDFADITITKYLDKSTPNILKFCSLGSHISDAKIELCAATGQKQPYLVYTLKDVYITGFQTTSSASGDQNRPVETFTLSFSKIQVDHTAWKADGSKGATTTYRWNMVTNAES